MIKRLFLFLNLLWECLRSVGLFFLVHALLNPVFKTETALMIGWLFSGSLVVIAADLYHFLLGRDAEPLLARFAGLSKLLQLIPAVLLLLLYSPFSLLSASGPFLLYRYRTLIWFVLALDVLVMIFLFLFTGTSEKREEAAAPTITQVEEE